MNFFRALAEKIIRPKRWKSVEKSSPDVQNWLEKIVNFLQEVAKTWFLSWNLISTFHGFHFILRILGSLCVGSRRSVLVEMKESQFENHLEGGSELLLHSDTAAPSRLDFQNYSVIQIRFYLFSKDTYLNENALRGFFKRMVSELIRHIVIDRKKSNTFNFFSLM